MSSERSESVHWLLTTAGRIRYIVRDGREHMPLVMLPGAAGCAEQMLVNYPEAKMIALDWPGSGESTSAWPRFTSRGLSAIVSEVLDALNLQDAVVVGHSLGAMAAMHLTRHPRVAHVVLVSPSPGFLPCLKAGIWAHPLYSIVVLFTCAFSLCNVFDVAEASKSDLNLAWLRHGLEQQTLKGERYVVTLAAFSRRIATAAGGPMIWLRRRLGDFGALFSVLTHVMPADICGKRTTLVWGSRDRLIDARACQLTCDLLQASNRPAYLVKVMPASGHFVHWDSPGEFSAVLSAVFKKQAMTD